MKLVLYEVFPVSERVVWLEVAASELWKTPNGVGNFHVNCKETIMNQTWLQWVHGDLPSIEVSRTSCPRYERTTQGQRSPKWLLVLVDFVIWSILIAFHCLQLILIDFDLDWFERILIVCFYLFWLILIYLCGLWLMLIDLDGLRLVMSYNFIFSICACSCSHYFPGGKGMVIHPQPFRPGCLCR